MTGTSTDIDHEALRVRFKSIIIKWPAVARSYPGGTNSFIGRYQPLQWDDALFLLSCMSLSDVDHVLAELESTGLVPGSDVAVCDMYQGPLLPCDGIRFDEEQQGDFIPSVWSAKIDPTYVAPEVAAAPEPAPALTPEATKAPKDTTSRPPTRVVFRTGPVHWRYHDDDGEE